MYKKPVEGVGFVDKFPPFDVFFVNSVIVGEAFPIEKTQKIKWIQPI